jgi:hypothetical protein
MQHPADAPWIEHNYDFNSGIFSLTVLPKKYKPSFLHIKNLSGEPQEWAQEAFNSLPASAHCKPPKFDK